jgi:two-component system LytT family response regulator
MKDTISLKCISIAGNSIFVKQQNEIIKINIDDLIYVKSNQNTVILQSTNNKFTVSSSMINVENLLSKKGFYRISRSHIVRINKIDIIGITFIKMGDLKIAIGAGYKRAFFNILSLVNS